MSFLLYDQRDVEYAERRGDMRLRSLAELGATTLQRVAFEHQGFLFGYQTPPDQYRATIGPYKNVMDRPESREQLAKLEDVLCALERQGIDVPKPRTWTLKIDEPFPEDLAFPLFVRTSTSSWKRGGEVAKVRNERELQEECELLRRAFHWDATILARQWVDLAIAGRWRYGNVPVEIRVWVVDGVPFAWSFHYLHALNEPKGFPPSDADQRIIAGYARQMAKPFNSRLIAFDFVLDVAGKWQFLEAGPGACSGTAHEAVFKAVASRLAGNSGNFSNDAVGGLLPTESSL